MRDSASKSKVGVIEEDTQSPLLASTYMCAHPYTITDEFTIHRHKTKQEDEGEEEE